MKIGLALGSGGLKGAAHIGVIQALEKANISIDMIAGTSAGSVIGSLYYAGYCGDELEQITNHIDLHEYVDYTISLSNVFAFLCAVVLRKLSFNISPATILPKGLVKGTKFEMYLNNLFSQKKCRDIPFFITSTDLHSAKQILFTNTIIDKDIRYTKIEPLTSLASHVRSSISIPGVFLPVTYKNMQLVDGGLSNNVPVDLLFKAGADKVIAIDLQNSILEDDSVDSIFEVMTRSLDILMVTNTNLRLSKYEYFLMSPALADVKLTNFNKIQECIQVGYNLTEEQLPRIRKYLYKTAIT